MEEEGYEEYLDQERQAEEDERAHIEAEAAAAEAEAMAKMAEEERENICPHCGSKNVEYSNYEWFCLDCDEHWDQYLRDTK